MRICDFYTSTHNLAPDLVVYYDTPKLSTINKLAFGNHHCICLKHDATLPPLKLIQLQQKLNVFPPNYELVFEESHKILGFKLQANHLVLK